MHSVEETSKAARGKGEKTSSTKKFKDIKSDLEAARERIRRSDELYKKMEAEDQEVICPREASSLSLPSATLTARLTGIFVKSKTTSKDTNSSQTLRVLSLMKSANSQEFLTVKSVFPTTGEKILAR